MKKILSVILAAGIACTACANVFADRREGPMPHNTRKIHAIDRRPDKDAIKLMGMDDEYGENDIYLDDEFYRENDDYAWMDLYLGENVANKFPEELQFGANTLTVTITDSAGTLIEKYAEIPVEYMWVDEYGGYISFTLNLMGIPTSTYSAQITLKDEDGKTYNLGSAELTMTDKMIIQYVELVNRNGNELTSGTKSFWGLASVSGLVVDCDKFDMNLVNSSGRIVAKTVDKAIQEINTSSSQLLFKLNVVTPLDSNDSYYLELTPSIDCINSYGSAYIWISDDPTVLRTEFIDSDMLKIYTENFTPGEYVLKTGYNEETICSFTVNNAGIAILPWEEGDYSYYSIWNADDEYICGFNVYNNERYETTYLDPSPSFISPKASVIENYCVRVSVPNTKVTAADYEYVNITQNGKVVASLDNIVIEGFSYYGINGLDYPYALIRGTLTVNQSRIEIGEAEINVKYKNGTVYVGETDVTDEKTGLFGYIDIPDARYVDLYINETYINDAIDTDKLSFEINETNVTSGTVNLLDSAYNIVETLALSELKRTDDDGFCYNYEGTFKTKLNANEIYLVELIANGRTDSSFEVIYYTEKYMDLYGDSVIINGEGSIWVDSYLNISNVNNVTFKAISKGIAYDVPVYIYDTGSGGYIDYVADFSDIPKGIMTIKAYDGAEEITIGYPYSAYNAGYTTEPYIQGCGYNIINNERHYGIYGVNLNKINQASIKIYKIVDFPEDTYVKTKLQYVKETNLSKPYGKYKIELDSTSLAGLESGPYSIVYILDGKPCNSFDIYLFDENTAEFAGTTTTVSADGKTFTVNADGLATGNTVILGLYSGNRLIETRPAVYEGKDLKFTASTASYTDAKIMVWNKLGGLNPSCSAEIVK